MKAIALHTKLLFTRRKKELISTVSDSIILLRYVEVYGQILRGIAVIKMRGSQHDKDIREFSINEAGMHISKPFRNITGILTNTPVYLSLSEIEQLSNLFDNRTQ